MIDRCVVRQYLSDGTSNGPKLFGFGTGIGHEKAPDLGLS